ncbi:hypothetical protein FBZ93_12299 [Bradyrhizobium macuxiense]|uniref:Tyr recombinase domain-containing protein n=1 Tax=Bradyrhizobium macuxiense TaxID=1755647 RepID=A0A560KVN7_9BRAD|nr:hypothetical protein [Bradyrhizobium macuxiense]TWB87318.1 hypothetical protein FBZ93_12299 [Bradyrhizobium macuxiense]
MVAIGLPRWAGGIYAILMLLAKLGLRAGEVAILTLDQIDCRSGEMPICARGRQRARMPMPPDVGASVVTDLRDTCPTSSKRRLFLPTPVPRVGICIGWRDYDVRQDGLGTCRRPWLRLYHGAYILLRRLTIELLGFDATLSEIGRLL